MLKGDATAISKAILAELFGVKDVKDLTLATLVTS
jgi:hypothetical protein